MPVLHVIASGTLHRSLLATSICTSALISRWRDATGELKLAPDVSAEAIRERAGLLDPTPGQAKAFWHENEPHMLPADHEP
jgi:hypothetical protein